MWDIIIRYTNGKTKIYSGITDYPKNFDDFLELMGLERWGYAARWSIVALRGWKRCGEKTA